MSEEMSGMSEEMSENMSEKMTEMADACENLRNASLTVDARIDDELSNRIRDKLRLPWFRDGAKASDVAISLFGDAGNSEILAVDKRLLLMRDAGEVSWKDGRFRLVPEEVIIDHRETCRNLWRMLRYMMRGCTYDHEVTGGFIMSEDVEIGGFNYHVKYRIDDSEEELIAEDALDWEEHVVQIIISPTEDMWSGWDE